ncbi:hypothetical protein GGS23DRAFT_130668 [Durotheca rogersii]|uniref:uncharacterized protein n=1 Tax=Durotheca rogersii TaxID=419775 RepID=UPI00222024E3|nr:uncharacterized protein GGS23DRAFT_130668 [Durotheca rogersii]KAI5861771.1 hypothetical protein GGS23DRAFT_130668 [Durotheca rogersii]
MSLTFPNLLILSLASTSRATSLVGGPWSPRTRSRYYRHTNTRSFSCFVFYVYRRLSVLWGSAASSSPFAGRIISLGTAGRENRELGRPMNKIASL